MNFTRKHPGASGRYRIATATACALVVFAIGASALALGATQTAPAKNYIRVDDLKVITMVPPVYPPAAKNKKNALAGTVVLDIIVGKKGAPITVTVSKSLRADYDKSAVDAVKQWRWQPYLLNGTPTEVETSETVLFTLKS